MQGPAAQVAALALLVPAACRHDSAPAPRYFELRGGLDNCRLRFLRAGKGRVAFLGGSITHNPGWRDFVASQLERRFPGVELEFINAGIPSMGSTPGAFRLRRDVLARGRVDLLFQEAAVNDHANGRTASEQLRGVEGIVRQALAANPFMDVVLLHFAMPEHLTSYRRGRRPGVIAQHERVAEHYGLASLDLAREVTARIAAGEFTWKDDFKDLHPSPFGSRLYAAAVHRMLEAAWREPPRAGAGLRARTLPVPLDRNSYARGRLVPIDAVKTVDGFARVESWRPRDGARTRRGFVAVPMLVATEPGASLSLPFEGTAVGLFVAAGPDAGVVEFRVDGAPWTKLNLFTRWSGRLHLPWAHVLAADLEPGPHRLDLRVSSDKNVRSAGHAVRIAHFLAN